MTTGMGHLIACAESEAKAQARRLEQGIDPDEDTIYNVLCPQIRSKWSPLVERERRVTKCQPVDYGLYENYHNSRVIHTSPVE